MAISREKAAKLREDYLLKREEILQGRVDTIAIKLFDRIFNDYLSNLEQANGKIVNNSKNIKAVQGLDEIYDRFNNDYNIPTLKGMISDLRSITPLNKIYFKTISDKPTEAISKEALKVVDKNIGIDAKGKIIHNGFADKVIKDKSVIKAIKKQTLKSITQKQGFQQFKNTLKESIEGTTGKPLSGKLQQYYRNYAYDTFMKVDRINADVFANDLGLNFFFWTGGVITTSRYLCIHANGKIFDARELKQMNFRKLKTVYISGITEEWVPLVDLGMWGCRHLKNFIPDEEALSQPENIFNVQQLSTEPIKKFPINKIK